MQHIRNIIILTLVLLSVTQVRAGLQRQERVLQQTNGVYLPLVLKAKSTPTPTITSTPTRTSTPTSTPIVTPPQGTSSIAQQVVILINSERAKIANCPALRLNDKLTAAAQAHSQDMADNNFFDHTGSNGSTLGQRITAAGYSFSLAGENIAGGQSTAQEAFDDWMSSPGHRANMLNCSFVDTGLGFVEKPGSEWLRYWTQDFAKPR